MKVSKAELLRRALDAAFGIDDGAQRRRQVIQATAGVLPDALDWPEWLAAVRGRTAQERLHDLGL